MVDDSLFIHAHFQSRASHITNDLKWLSTVKFGRLPWKLLHHGNEKRKWKQTLMPWKLVCYMLCFPSYCYFDMETLTLIETQRFPLRLVSFRSEDRLQIVTENYLHPQCIRKLYMTEWSDCFKIYIRLQYRRKLHTHFERANLLLQFGVKIFPSAQKLDWRSWTFVFF